MIDGRSDGKIEACGLDILLEVDPITMGPLVLLYKLS